MKLIPKEVTQTAFRQVLVLKKNSPRIMFAGGITGVLVGTVLACRATLKLSEELPEMKQNLEDAKDKSVTEHEKRVEVSSVYVDNVLTVAKLYAPAVIVGSLSIGALTGSHVQLTRRNAGLTAAYAAVAKAYDEYRLRVQKDLGTSRELELYHAAELTEVQGEIGKKKVLAASPGKWSPYARFFDEGSVNFQKNPELNKLYIQCQQAYANDLLQVRGHLFLNEVYDSLGIARSSAGAVVGWVISPDGDNFVDFGLFEATSSEFINGHEPRVLLDFNVDGVIYELIEGN